ncbi:MAG: hypothetical protein ACTSRH_09730 [Promethearchaeota archaeon]
MGITSSNNEIYQEDLSRTVIPFEKFFKVKNEKDIYSGKEKIPFKLRKKEFQQILIKEFLD